MEIAEKIGDIAGMAESMAQIGVLYLAQNQCETALKLLFQSFAICREKMTEEQFKAILKEFE